MAYNFLKAANVLLNKPVTGFNDPTIKCVDSNYVYIAARNDSNEGYIHAANKSTLDNTYQILCTYYAGDFFYGDMVKDSQYVYASDYIDQKIIALQFDGSTFSKIGSDCTAPYVNSIYHDGSYLYAVCGFYLKVFSVNGSTFTELDSELIGDEIVTSVRGNGTYIFVSYAVDLGFGIYGKIKIKAFSFNGSSLTPLAISDTIGSDYSISDSADFFVSDSYIFLCTRYGSSVGDPGLDGLFCIGFNGSSFSILSQILDNSSYSKGHYAPFFNSENNVLFSTGGGSTRIKSYLFNGTELTLDGITFSQPRVLFYSNGLYYTSQVSYSYTYFNPITYDIPDQYRIAGTEIDICFGLTGIVEPLVNRISDQAGIPPWGSTTGADCECIRGVVGDPFFNNNTIYPRIYDYGITGIYPFCEGFTGFIGTAGLLSIINQPESFTGYDGETGTICVGATGYDVIYQWYKIEYNTGITGAVSGETGPCISFLLTGTDDSDGYFVKVIDNGDTGSPFGYSDIANLSVYSNPGNDIGVTGASMFVVVNQPTLDIENNTRTGNALFSVIVPDPIVSIE